MTSFIFDDITENNENFSFKILFHNILRKIWNFLSLYMFIYVNQFHLSCMFIKERLPRQAWFCSCLKCTCSGNDPPDLMGRESSTAREKHSNVNSSKQELSTKFNPQSTVYLGLDIRYFLVRREMNISQWTVDCFLASSRLVETNT